MILLQLTPSDRFEKMSNTEKSALLFYAKVGFPTHEQVLAERERKAEEALKSLVNDILTLDQVEKEVSSLERSLGIDSRVYPTRMFKIEDEQLHDAFEELKSYGNEVGFESEMFSLMQKSLLKEIRSMLDTKCVLGYAYEENAQKKQVVLFEFPVMATEDNRFIPQFDQEMQLPYITL